MSTVESQPAYSDARLIVVMGSSGCGKSTIGAALAKQLNAHYIEGDDHHTPENKAKMSSGVPLTDDDRLPWLKQFAAFMCNCDGVSVASCSALKRSYRECINKVAQEPVLYVYLHAKKSVLASRLAKREGHFMNRNLLDDQLATLEAPSEDEFSIMVDVDQSIDNIIVAIEQNLKS